MEMKEEESERDKSNSLEIGEELHALHYVDSIKFFTVKKKKKVTWRTTFNYLLEEEQKMKGVRWEDEEKVAVRVRLRVRE